MADMNKDEDWGMRGEWLRAAPGSTIFMQVPPNHILSNGKPRHILEPAIHCRDPSRDHSRTRLLSDLATADRVERALEVACVAILGLTANFCSTGDVGMLVGASLMNAAANRISRDAHVFNFVFESSYPKLVCKTTKYFSRSLGHTRYFVDEARYELSIVAMQLNRSIALMTCGDPGISAFPEGDNIFSWVGTIKGSEGTVYAGLSYKLSLRFPSDQGVPKVCITTRENNKKSLSFSTLAFYLKENIHNCPSVCTLSHHIRTLTLIMCHQKDHGIQGYFTREIARPIEGISCPLHGLRSDFTPHTIINPSLKEVSKQQCYTKHLVLVKDTLSKGNSRVITRTTLKVKN